MRYGDDDYGGSSLQQSLLSAARHWEQERAQESARLRRQISEANRTAEAERAKVRTEVAKTAELEAKLRDESAKLKEAESKLKAMTAENTQHRLQAIGAFLMLAELRLRMKALSPVPVDSGGAGLPAIDSKERPDEARLSELIDASAELEPPASPGGGRGETGAGDAVDGAEGSASGEGDESVSAKKKKKKKKKKGGGGVAAADKGDLEAAAAVAAVAHGDDDEEEDDDEPHSAESKPTNAAEEEQQASAVTATSEKASDALAASKGGVATKSLDRQLSMGAAAWENVQSLLETLPPIVRAEELLEACKEGKGRSIESFFSQYTLCDAMEARAQDLLVEGLEECAMHGRGALVKTLIDGGADAHRTSALHICIRHGHVNILNHLITNVAMSVNRLDDTGSSPLHVAAAANQPKAAQFLLKHCASIDAQDAEGRTALDIATAMRWKEMQRVLQDPGVLFWNRSSRATKLYKQGEYEEACGSYELALNEMSRMVTRPPAETQATFYFNFGRSAQSAGLLTRACELLTSVLDLNPSHQRALEHRLDCFEGLTDYDSALSDVRELKGSFGDAVEATQRQAWARREASL